MKTYTLETDNMNRRPISHKEIESVTNINLTKKQEPRPLVNSTKYLRKKLHQFSTISSRKVTMSTSLYEVSITLTLKPFLKGKLQTQIFQEHRCIQVRWYMPIIPALKRLRQEN
jgi:hypothetical protein